MTTNQDLHDHQSRGHALLSPSGAKRWLTCTPSARMIEEVQKKFALPEESSEYAKEGTVAHEIAEKLLTAYVSGEELPTIEEVTPHLIEQGYEEFEPEFPAIYETVRLKYFEIIVELYESLNDAKLYPEVEVDFSDIVPEGHGISDCVITSEDTLYVIDLKYGVYPVEAKENPQLRLYALGALEKFEDPLFSSFENVSMTIIQPRIADSIKQDIITVQELKKWANDYVKPRAEMAWKGEGKQVTGEHCRYCDAKATCPAQALKFQEFIRILVKDEETETLKSGNLTPEDISKILPYLDGAETWIRAVKDRAEEEMILGSKVPGYKLVESRGKKIWDSEEDAVARMKQCGLTDDEIWQKKIITPSQARNLISDDDVSTLNQAVVYQRGSATLAPESDKRPELSREYIRKLYDLQE